MHEPSLITRGWCVSMQNPNTRDQLGREHDHRQLLPVA